MGCIDNRMELFMRDSGEMTFNMDSERKDVNIIKLTLKNKGPDGSSYKGGYDEGRKQGKGKYTWPDGSYYEGEWVDNKINGSGEYYWADGRVYKG